MARPTSRVAKVEVEGPLAPFAAAYTAKLTNSGYTPLTMVNELRQVAHLSRWVEVGAVAAAHLTTERLEEFLAPRRATKGHRGCSMRGLVLLLEVMIDMEVVVRGLTPPPGSVGEAALAMRHGLIAVGEVVD